MSDEVNVNGALIDALRWFISRAHFDDPATVTIKGPSTSIAAGQFDFSNGEHEVNGVEFYMLLCFWDGDDSRCEISRPHIPGPDGRITGWDERILVYRGTPDPLRPKHSATERADNDPPAMRRRVA